MTQSPTPSLLNLVNMPDLLDRVDNDRELLQELFQLLRAEFPRLQIELQEAISSKNMQQTARSAHTLKGMFANLSIERAAATVETLENMASQGDQPGTENALIVFNNEVATLMPSLDAYLAEQRV
jgi:HPt (histidine-containing phosphotransfer) domain-containing protein